MADTPTVYVICDNNCKYEGLTKEQIYAAIIQAIETGSIGNCDTGFITTIKTINDIPLRFFVGSQAEYDALTTEEKANLFAIINEDATKDELLKTIANLKDGTESVQHANEAEHAANADLAKMLKDCKEATYDENNGGFIITEAGIYMLIGFYESEESEGVRVYQTDTIAIPFTDIKAYGAPTLETQEDGTTKIYKFMSLYDSYDAVNEPYNPSKYRLSFNPIMGLTHYKAIKLASL